MAFDEVMGFASLYPSYNSSPLRRLERLRRVDIQKRPLAVDRDFRHRLAVPRDQMAGADIALERHQFVEELARPQHRSARPPVPDVACYHIAPPPRDDVH